MCEVHRELLGCRDFLFTSFVDKVMDFARLSSFFRPATNVLLKWPSGLTVQDGDCSDKKLCLKLEVDSGRKFGSVLRESISIARSRGESEANLLQRLSHIRYDSAQKQWTAPISMLFAFIEFYFMVFPEALDSTKPLVNIPETWQHRRQEVETQTPPLSESCEEELRENVEAEACNAAIQNADDARKSRELYERYATRKRKREWVATRGTLPPRKTE